MRSFISFLATPSGVAYTLFLAGLVLGIFRRTRGGSWWLLATAGLITLAFSSGMIASAFMSPIEYTYPKLEHSTAHQNVKRIVVLTGWADDDPNMTVTGRLGTSSAYRVLMAMELARDCPDCETVISGSYDAARLMGEALVKLGLERDKVHLEPDSLTTADSAVNVKKMLGTAPFFLITSAGHMPRAAETMRRLNLQPIPAPTEHQLPKDWRKAELKPSPTSLMASDLAIHEYIGAFWYKLSDRMNLNQ